ncbi:MULTISPECIES: hypothetical protein, partial [unclassified Myroides]|uniref:hypothetical protein n=1 Tax=unclassified Myroides TaxID=2642485 RepID=UPI003D2F5F31
MHTQVKNNMTVLVRVSVCLFIGFVFNEYISPSSYWFSCSMNISHLVDIGFVFNEYISPSSYWFSCSMNISHL